jgi:hypothetical protein
LLASGAPGLEIDPGIFAIEACDDGFALSHFRFGSMPSPKYRKAPAGTSPMTMS